MPSINHYARRRRALAKHIGKHAIAVISANQEQLRNGDAHYPFRQNSDFYYLTGFNEPEAVLIVVGGHAGESILFNRPRHPEQEQWTGKRLGQEEAIHLLGMHTAYPIEELALKLPQYLEGRAAIYYTIGQDAVAESMLLRLLATLKQQRHKKELVPGQLADLEPILSEMRLFKSKEEIKLIKKAAEISIIAHQHAMQQCSSVHYEYQLEAALRYIFTQHGCSGVAYEPIVASGQNACVLHYCANHAPLQKGELVLIDAAGEYLNYAADITRTFPINGQFSAAQRDLYELVLTAQRAAIRLVKPGVIWSAMQDEIVKIITAGLRDLKVLSGSIDGLIEQQAYKPFYMHGSGHWLGLDVHDSGHYKQQGHYRALEPGMVFTIEPGLYISAHTKGVPKRWWNMGIRIEDDLLVTTSGHENLTAALAVDPDDIEAYMRSFTGLSFA